MSQRKFRTDVSLLAWTLALATGLAMAGITPVQAAPITRSVNCPTDSLAAAITSVHPGDTLVISGTCVGNFDVGKKLTLTGSTGALLDGGGLGTTLTTDSIKKVVVQNLTITGGVNTQGGGINNSGGLILRNTTVTGNSGIDVTDEGGGIFNSGTLTLFGSNVSANNGGSGSGIYNTGSLSIWGSAVDDNQAEYTGGIYNSGSLSMWGSTVRSNSGQTGGVDNLGTMTLTRSTISNNSGGGGGGFYNGGTAILDNSTVSDNSGLYVGAIGNSGTLTLRHSTVSGNASGWFEVYPGGIWSPEGTVRLDSSIVAGNTGSDAQDCSGAITSNGYNLIGDAAGCDFTPATGDQVGSSLGSGVIDPKLGPIANNGGKTQTQALLPASPALDAIPVGTIGADGVTPLCPPSGTSDQRYVVRPQGTACDIGAFERKAGTALPIMDQSFTSPSNLNGNINECCRFAAQTFTAGLTGTLTGINIDVHSYGSFPLHVAIRTVVNGLPGATVLGSVLLSPNDAPLSRLIAFPQTIQVSAGVQYAIVVDYPSAPATGEGGGWTGATGDVYPGGDSFSSYLDGVSWQVGGGQGDDLHFRTYVRA